MSLMSALSRWLLPEQAAAIALEQYMDRKAHPAGHDLVTESAQRHADAITTEVRQWQERCAQDDSGTIAWLNAASLPPPHGPDVIVFGPRRT